MAPIDKDRILRYEAEIRESRDLLAKITSDDINVFVRDTMKIRAMKYTLITLVEAICNICRHILAKKEHVVVEEYADAILKMLDKNFLSEDTGKALVPLTKLRHQLIHGYWKTEDRRLFTESRENLKIIDQFIAEVHRLLANS